eukprot:362203-Chlamydomonas_euryale.AAC.13
MAEHKLSLEHANAKLRRYEAQLTLASQAAQEQSSHASALQARVDAAEAAATSIQAQVDRLSAEKEGLQRQLLDAHVALDAASSAASQADSDLQASSQEYDLAREKAEALQMEVTNATSRVERLVDQVTRASCWSGNYDMDVMLASLLLQTRQFSLSDSAFPVSCAFALPSIPRDGRLISSLHEELSVAMQRVDELTGYLDSANALLDAAAREKEMAEKRAAAAVQVSGHWHAALLVYGGRELKQECDAEWHIM